MPLPLFHVAAASVIAFGVGVVVYENREEIQRAFEDIKFGFEAALERHRRRKVAVARGYQPNRYSGQAVYDDNDDDLYHVPSASGTEREDHNRNNVNSNDHGEHDDVHIEETSDEDGLWDSTRTLRAQDGQTSGVYDRKATFRSRRGGTPRRTQPPPSYSFSSEIDDPTTATSSLSSGEETPEDDANEKVGYGNNKPLLNL